MEVPTLKATSWKEGGWVVTWFCVHFPAWPFSPRVCMLSCSVVSLCNPLDCSSPGFSVRGVLQARILEWVAVSFSRESSWSNSSLLCLLHWQVGSLWLAPPGKPFCSWDAANNDHRHLHHNEYSWSTGYVPGPDLRTLQVWMHINFFNLIHSCHSVNYELLSHSLYSGISWV